MKHTILAMLFALVVFAEEAKTPAPITKPESDAIEKLDLRDALIQQQVANLQYQYRDVQQARRAVMDEICTSRKLAIGCTVDLKTGAITAKVETKTEAAKEAAK